MAVGTLARSGSGLGLGWHLARYRTLMLGAFVLPAGLLFHAYWRVEDPAERQTQQMAFLRNVALAGASLALFACFTTLGDQVRFVVAGPLTHL